MPCGILVLQKITKKMSREGVGAILIYKRATRLIPETREITKKSASTKFEFFCIQE